MRGLAAWAGAEAILALALALAGPSAVSMLAIMALPVVPLAVRLPQRRVWAGVAIAVGLTVAVALSADADAVTDEPLLLIAPLVVVVGVAALSVALVRSDRKRRDDAILDPLTGLLGRTSLADRARELEQQSAINREPVGVIAVDVDEFMAIVELLGTTAGDAVLSETACCLRQRFQFGLIYRLGGDEFLILVPGADLDGAVEIAAELRASIRAADFGIDRRVTVSCGVSASAPGEPFDFARAFQSAIQALERAQQGDGLASETSAPVEVLAGT